MIISPFTPLNFNPNNPTGIECRYIQTFASSDWILIELIGNNDDIEQAYGEIFIEPGHIKFCEISFSTWQVNSETYLKFTTLSLSKGMYSVEINGISSNLFRVTDNQIELAKTTLIQYSMMDNRQRNDALFFIDGMQYFFDFRVPGGFKDCDWSFGVEGEQFITDAADIIQLYGLEFTQKKFTLGNSEGCHVWFAEMLNRILCCSYVYFNGERYARKESSTPEMTTLIDGHNGFVFHQNLQRVNIEPSLAHHKALIRRINESNYRIIPENVPRSI